MKDFVYALRHYHWAPDQPHFFGSYEEYCISTPTVIDGKKAATIFLKTKPGRDRAMKLGWVDETAQLRESLSPKVMGDVTASKKRKYTKRKK